MISSPLLGAAKKDMALFAILGAILVFIGTMAWLDTLRTKLTIDDHTLSIQRAFSSRSMLRDEIKGYSIREKGRIAIVSKNAGSKSILLPPYLGKETALRQWLTQSFPDVDLLNQAEETQNILANEEFGVTKDERESRLAKAKQVSKVANVIGLAAGAWAFFYPTPYNECILILLVLPWVGIYIIWHFKGLIRFDAHRKSAYPSLTGLFLFATLGLILRMIIDFHIYQYDHLWISLTLATIIITLLCLLAGNKALREAQQKTLAVILLFAFIATYCYGAIIFTNYYYDKSVPQQYTVEVKTRHVSRSRSTTYYLGLDAWGQFTEEKDVSVSRGLYNIVQTGDSVRVIVWKGKWDIPWFEVTPWN